MLRRGRLRVAACAALILAVSVHGAAGAPPACEQRSAGQRCPVAATDFRDSYATAWALSVDASRGLAVTTGWTYPTPQLTTTVAFDADTTEIAWTHVLGAPGQRTGGAAYAVATDALHGRTFVGGHWDTHDRTSTHALTYALDTTSGRQLWTAAAPTSGGYGDSVAHLLVSPGGKVVYAVGTRGLPAEQEGDQRFSWHVIAHDAATGEVLWTWTRSTTTGQDSVTDAALTPNGRTLVLTGPVSDTKARFGVVALDTRTRAVRWQHLPTADQWADSRLALDTARRRVVVATQRWGDDDPWRMSVGVMVRDLRSGRLRWTRTISEPGTDVRLGAVALTGSRAIVSTATASTESWQRDWSPVVSAFSRRGRPLWHTRTPTDGSATLRGLLPAGPDRLYAFGERDDRGPLGVVRRDGDALLYALDPADGTISWHGLTSGSGDDPGVDAGEATVGAAAVGEHVLTLVRHREATPALLGQPADSAYVLQKWER